MMMISNVNETEDNTTVEARIQSSLDLIWRYGMIPGEHHKQWILDQVARILTGTKKAYEDWRRLEEDEEEEYAEWDGGIATQEGAAAEEANGADWDEGIAP